MATDPDEIWRPDYTGPDPVSDASLGFDEIARRSRSSTAPRGPARRGFAVVAAAVVGALLVGVSVVVASRATDPGDPSAATTEQEEPVVESLPRLDSSDDLFGGATGLGDGGVVGDRLGALDHGLDGGVHVGADPRRLPEFPVARWSRPLATGTSTAPVDLSESSVAVIDSRYVATVHGAGGARLVDTSLLEVHDAGSGRLVWSIELPARASTFGLVGAVDDVLLLESSLAERRLAGYDLADGSERWSHAEPPGRFDVIGEAGGFELVAGSPLVARTPVVDTDPTLLFDPTSGEAVGRLDGRIIGYDGVGAWHVFLEGSITTHDLSEGYSVGRPLGSIWSPTGRGDVVDGRIVQPDRGRIFVSRAETAGVTIGVVDSDTHSIDVPASISTISAMAGPTMVISGAGEVIGAQLVGNVVRPTWRRTGVVQEMFPTLDGHLLLLATRGGAQQEVIDGRTGRTVLALTLAPGVFDSLVVAGNGIVARRISPDGPRLAAHDLSGVEIWSLEGDQPAAVGDGVVARLEPGADGAVLAVYGKTTGGSGASRGSQGGLRAPGG